MTSEKFCLKWNDFESNISVSFKSIREDKELFDVTLACDDNQIQAHKLILSACSPFFRDVFRRNPHQHPLLYLRGIKYRDIESILQFMYHGEVNVAQEDLNNFLSISEELRVKGLTQGKDEKTDPVKQPSPSVSSVPRQAQSNKSSVRSVTERMQYQEEEDEIEEIIPIKSEPVPSHESLGQAVTQVDVNPPGGYDENYEEYAAYDEANYTVDATEGNKGEVRFNSVGSLCFVWMMNDSLNGDDDLEMKYAFCLDGGLELNVDFDSPDFRLRIPVHRGLW